MIGDEVFLQRKSKNNKGRNEWILLAFEDRDTAILRAQRFPSDDYTTREKRKEEEKES